jgi:hypothetical protein
MHVSSAPRLDGAELHFCSPFKRLLLPRKTCGDFIGGLSEVLAREPMGSEKEERPAAPIFGLYSAREVSWLLIACKNCGKGTKTKSKHPGGGAFAAFFLLLLGLSVPGYFLFKTASTSSVISCPPYSTADLSNTAGMDFCAATALIAC